MKQKVLQFNSEKYNHLYNEKNIFWSLVALIVFCSIFYMYCVTTTIHHIVAREQAESHLADLIQRISSEEFDFINLKNDVTLDKAYALGFKDVANKVFVSQKTVGYVTMNTNSI